MISGPWTPCVCHHVQFLQNTRCVSSWQQISYLLLYTFSLCKLQSTLHINTETHLRQKTFNCLAFALSNSCRKLQLAFFWSTQMLWFNWKYVSVSMMLYWQYGALYLWLWYWFYYISIKELCTAQIIYYFDFYMGSRGHGLIYMGTQPHTARIDYFSVCSYKARSVKPTFSAKHFIEMHVWLLQ